MADADKAKAERLAAAKKRVEQMKKAKAKQAGGGAKKDKKAKAEAKEEPVDDKKDKGNDENDENENDAHDEHDDNEDAVASPTSPRSPSAKTATISAPSLSEQSRLRSTSFRHGGPPGPLSPSADGETAADIYRKQAARIDELERQNKRLGKDAADAEKRWQKAEEALVDVREGSGSGGSDELAKLKSEVAALQRQNSQLQTRTTHRHGSSPSISMGSPPTSELEVQLQSKATTIETMELEMSRLRAQVERLSVGGEGGDSAASSAQHYTPQQRQDQVAALEEKLARAEKAAGTVQNELAELKRNLGRTSEKAVREGSARTSAETKLHTLEAEVAALQTERDALAKRAEALDKKVATLTTLHKEQDARSQALRRDKERADHELAEARTRLDRVEAENLKLRKREALDAGGTDSEHLDELEDEERQRLERRVRALEAENADLRHGIWHDRRKELQVGPDDEVAGGVGSSLNPGAAVTGHRFSDVDLSSTSAAAAGRRPGSRGVGTGGVLGGFITALTGSDGQQQYPHQQHHRQRSSVNRRSVGGGVDDDDSFLDDDDDMDFDEEAYRRAQEEEVRRRVELIKAAQAALKNWEGWRLDLVESRQGGQEGIGPIFEI